MKVPKHKLVVVAGIVLVVLSAVALASFMYTPPPVAPGAGSEKLWERDWANEEYAVREYLTEGTENLQAFLPDAGKLPATVTGASLIVATDVGPQGDVHPGPVRVRVGCGDTEYASMTTTIEVSIYTWFTFGMPGGGTLNETGGCYIGVLLSEQDGPFAWMMLYNSPNTHFGVVWGQDAGSTRIVKQGYTTPWSNMNNTTVCPPGTEWSEDGQSCIVPPLDVPWWVIVMLVVLVVAVALVAAAWLV